MVALLVLVLVLADAVLILFPVVFFTLAIVVGLERALLAVAALGAEPTRLRLPHLVEVAATPLVILENLVFLVPRVLVLQLFDHIVRLLPPLNVFEVVHIEFVLEVVNVGILLNVNVVEALKLLFETLVLLLVLRLDILDAFEPLFGTLELSATALDLIGELSLVLFELLDRVDHLAHLALLRVDYIADALLDVLLL